MVNHTQHSVQPTSGILRDFQAFSTPQQNPASKPCPRPAHLRLTQAVSPSVGNADRWGATRSCASSCYDCNITSLTAVLQDITRCSATGIPSTPAPRPARRSRDGRSALPGRAGSGQVYRSVRRQEKPFFWDADGVRSLRDKGIPHPNGVAVKS